MPPSDILPDHLRQGYGCETCWPVSATQALEARGTLVAQHHLIDESHYSVRILACGVCGQRFLSVFTERVDWEHGNDPQEYQLAPISGDEAEGLVAAGDSITTEQVEQAARERYVVVHRFPSSGERTTTWVPFLMVGWHD